MAVLKRVVPKRNQKENDLFGTLHFSFRILFYMFLALVGCLRVLNKVCSRCPFGE